MEFEINPKNSASYVDQNFERILINEVNRLDSELDLTEY
jgi:hypothetical protein